MRAVVLVFACACNQVWGLDPTEVQPENVDTDHDGLFDATDNCPDDYNDKQEDEDGDGPGNACDNCPLLANADQQDVGDGDGVGDRCDPHPVGTRDCLIVFDSFDDRDRFAMHWQITDTSAGRVRAIDGGVELGVGPTGSLSISLLGEDGSLVADRLETQLTARFEAGVLWIGTNPFSTLVGEWYGISEGSANYQQISGGGYSTTTISGVFVPPLADEIYLRLDATTASGATEHYYLVDWGLMLVTNRNPTPLGATGAPSVVLTRGNAVVTGFTAYKNVGTNATCPTPIRR